MTTSGQIFLLKFVSIQLLHSYAELVNGRFPAKIIATEGTEKKEGVSQNSVPSVAKPYVTSSPMSKLAT
jgi:hypothetical protein